MDDGPLFVPLVFQSAHFALTQWATEHGLLTKKTKDGYKYTKVSTNPCYVRTYIHEKTYTVSLQANRRLSPFAIPSTTTLPCPKLDKREYLRADGLHVYLDIGGCWLDCVICSWRIEDSKFCRCLTARQAYKVTISAIAMWLMVAPCVDIPQDVALLTAHKMEELSLCVVLG